MFSPQTKALATAYRIDPRDVLFCHLIATGADKGDAYTAIYYRSQGKISHEMATTRAADTIKNNPAFAVLIRKLKQEGKQRTGTTTNRAPKYTKDDAADLLTDEERQQKEQETAATVQEYKDRDKVLEKIILSTDKLAGKDELQGLLSIAKFQGFDREKLEANEQRVFYLPWVSNCKGCKLMQIYRQNAIL